MALTLQAGEERVASHGNPKISSVLLLLGRPALSRFFATTNNLAPPAFLVVDSAKSASGSFVHCFNQQLCAEDPRPMAEGACLKP